MKDTIRLFAAAILPEALKEKLQQQLAPFAHPHMRPMPKQNLHLTLYFIGNVPARNLDHIKQQLSDTARQFNAFTLQLARTEPGPNPNKPRLVWARFNENHTFEQLSKVLAERLSAQEPTLKKPIPHVTLARFRKDKPAPPMPEVNPPAEPLALHVNGIALWKSELAAPHPFYSVLDAYPLGQNLPPAIKV